MQGEISTDYSLISMLYDFHSSENAKKPRSVNAIYLIVGQPRKGGKNGASSHGTAGDGNDEMTEGSSFMMSSQLQDLSLDGDFNSYRSASVPVTSVVLVREDELDGQLNCGLRFSSFPWQRSS